MTLNPFFTPWPHGARRLVAALASGLALAVSPAALQAQVAAPPSPAPDAGARTVRVVCIAESAATLADQRYLLLHRMSGLFQFFGDNVSAADIEKLIKAKYPPVGRWHFLPAGTGYVVHHTEKESYVVTNWHVAVGCSADERRRVQLGVIEGTGNEIQPILADHVAISGEKLPQRVQALCRDSTGRKACGLRLPNAKGIPGAPGDAEEALKNDANVLFYVPDVAVLRLRERSRAAPVVFAAPAAPDSLKGRNLQIVGYPQVAMELQQSEFGTRRALAAEVTTPASFSRIEPLKREQVGADAQGSISLDLLQLAAQVHPGNSGGPLLDDGKVVGMVTSTVSLGARTRRTDSEASTEGVASPDTLVPAGYALAIKASDVMAVLRSLGVPFVQAATAAPGAGQGASRAASGAVAVASSLAAPSPAQAEVEASGLSQQQGLLIAGLTLLALVLAAAGYFHLANRRAAGLAATPRAFEPPTSPVEPTRVLQPNAAPAASHPAALVLRADSGPIAGRYPVPLPNGSQSLYIGRDPKSCQVVLPNHLDMVSSVHCCVTWTAQTRSAALRDVSTNGTWVNGKKVLGGTQVLRHGDTVDLGAPQLNRFVVELL